MVRGSVELLEESWKRFTPKQKKKLLRSRGLDPSWSATRTIKEMVGRGGGTVAKDLHYLYREWRKRNPTQEVRF